MTEYEYGVDSYVEYNEDQIKAQEAYQRIVDKARLEAAQLVEELKQKYAHRSLEDLRLELVTVQQKINEFSEGREPVDAGLFALEKALRELIAEKSASSN